MVQSAGGGEALVAQLGLAFAAQRGAYEHRQALLGQLVGDKLAVGTVVQRGLDAELLGDTDGGEDVVGPVSVAFQGNFTVDDRQHGLQLHVEGGILPGQLIIPVTASLEQQLPQQCCHRHPGHGTLLQALSVAALGVFAEGAFHGGGLLQQHIVYPFTGQLQHREGAAHHVGAAGAGAGGGDTTPQGVGEGTVLRIDGVDGPQLRRQGFHDLIVVHALPAQTLIVQTDVTVGLHAAGGQQTAACVDDGAALWGVDVGSDGGDAAILRQQAAVGQLRPDDGHDVGVLNEDHGDPSCFHRLG